MHRWSFVALSLLLACQTSYSSKFQNEEGGFPEPSSLLKNALGENQQLASIGRLQGAMSCTAWLWKPKADVQGKALAITNGHCVMPYYDRATTFEVWRNKEAPKSWNLKLNYFVDTVNQHKTFAVTSVVYATMKSIDFAIIELNVTWAELERDGFLPLRLAEKAPKPWADIRVIGVPEHDFPSEQRYLRAANCAEETRVSVVEWYWTWFDTHRNSCADVREGSSGSPVFNAAGEVFALINTTTAGGITDSCYLGNPCEMQRTGAIMFAEKNYAIDLHGLANCYQDQQLHFGSDCPLPPTETIAYSQAPYIPTRPEDRQDQPIHWNLLADPSLWKSGPVGSIDCRKERDYLEQPLPTGEIPKDNGVHLLCLLGKDADERFPSIVVLTVDTKPPTLKPELSILTRVNGLSFEPIFQVPELADFLVGYGPKAGTDCEQLPLRPYRRIPIPIDGKDLPATICVKGADIPGNWGPVFSYDTASLKASGLRGNVGSQRPGQEATEHNVIRKQ